MEATKLKKRLQKIERAKQTKKQGAKILWIAALIVVLIGWGSLFLVNVGIDSHKLYAANFQPYPDTLKPVVRSNTTIESLP